MAIPAWRKKRPGFIAFRRLRTGWHQRKRGPQCALPREETGPRVGDPVSQEELQWACGMSPADDVPIYGADVTDSLVQWYCLVWLLATGRRSGTKSACGMPVGEHAAQQAFFGEGLIVTRWANRLSSSLHILLGQRIHSGRLLNMPRGTYIG